MSLIPILTELISTSEACLSEIRRAMVAYKDARALVNANRLDFLEEEVSRRLELANLQRRLLESAFDLGPSRPFIYPIVALTYLRRSNKELRAAITKNLEANLLFLKSARESLSLALGALFEAWDAYTKQQFEVGESKAAESQKLTQKAVQSCLVGIAREYIRRAQSRISAGRRIFASLKDARKKLDQATTQFSRYERELAGKWTSETRETLQSVIKVAGEAAVEAEYSIEDAKWPFLLYMIMLVLAIIGATAVVYNAIKYFGIV